MEHLNRLRPADRPRKCCSISPATAKKCKGRHRPPCWWAPATATRSMVGSAALQEEMTMGRLLSGVRSGMTSCGWGGLAGSAASAGAQGPTPGRRRWWRWYQRARALAARAHRDGRHRAPRPIGSGNISALENGGPDSSLGVTTSAKNIWIRHPSSADSLAPYYDPPLLLPDHQFYAASASRSIPSPPRDIRPSRLTSGKQRAPVSRL